ncbi:MAG: helix-turn-helix transcriptional regulator [Candidatus Kerfeldbacteria bacterium]|nr:helix-turn-helix transcriptional regulator [Candidatus Kerfeldbacteria bacterium]
MNSHQHTEQLNQLAKQLQAAGDPVRIRIVCILFQDKQYCVGDFADMMQMSISATSHHLQILKEADLVSANRHGQMICYSIVKQPFTEQLKKMVC